MVSLRWYVFSFFRFPLESVPGLFRVQYEYYTIQSVKNQQSFMNKATATNEQASVTGETQVTDDQKTYTLKAGVCQTADLNQTLRVRFRSFLGRAGDMLNLLALLGARAAPNTQLSLLIYGLQSLQAAPHPRQ
jgi:hypothetical protein